MYCPPPQDGYPFGSNGIGREREKKGEPVHWPQLNDSTKHFATFLAEAVAPGLIQEHDLIRTAVYDKDL